MYSYRRRRAGAVLLAVVAGLLWAGSRAEAGRISEHHVVKPGDTLWSIAVDYYPPSEDRRVAIEEIRRENNLADYKIRPGTRLELPPVED